MKLVRPRVPLAVQVIVAAAQAQRSGHLKAVLHACCLPTARQKLDHLLAALFGDEPVHLDHDPALCLRHLIDAENGIYDPPANDPEFLVYRTAEEHRVKTFIRGIGAEFSDAAKRRRELKRGKAKPPSRWPPKGSRPLRGRPWK
jgi:hypothetical protein